jgi:hypothetical protein
MRLTRNYCYITTLHLLFDQLHHLRASTVEKLLELEKFRDDRWQVKKSKVKFLFKRNIKDILGQMSKA